MQITRFSDYSLRVLMYLSVHSDGLSNTATSFNISKNHLVEIIHHLAKTGLINSVRGRLLFEIN